MDGTLVDTHKALKMAYRRAGTVLTDENYGKRWQDWCPEDVHREKERLYPNFLREYVRVLPATSLLRVTNGAVITGADVKAVQAVQSVIGEFSIVGVNASADTKISLIASEMSDCGEVVWVDDNKEFGMRVLRELGATFAHAHEFDGVYHVYTKDAPDTFVRWHVSSPMLREVHDV